MESPHHQEELPPTVRVALNRLVQCQPSQQELQQALQRLERHIGRHPSQPLELREAQVRSHGTLPRLELAAACVLAIAVSLIAQTDAWGQVALDFARPGKEPQAISTLAASETHPTVADSHEPAPPWGIRALLLAHIVCLVLGLLGMLGAWCASLGGYVRSCFRWRAEQDSILSLENRLLLGSVSLYSLGVLWGAIWAGFTWGEVWRWAPKEVFCLLSMAVGVLWVGLVRQPRNIAQEQGRSPAHQVSLTTVACGTIILLVVLSSQFAAHPQVHSLDRGFASSRMLTAVFSFFSGVVVLIWLMRIVTAIARSRREATR